MMNTVQLKTKEDSLHRNTFFGHPLRSCEFWNPMTTDIKQCPPALFSTGAMRGMNVCVCVCVCVCGPQ